MQDSSTSEYGTEEMETPAKCPPVLQSATEFLQIEQSRRKMGTGSPELDSLIGGIAEGQTYLFYGDADTVGTLAHQLLVKCVAPQSQEGFGARAVYFNSTDYYSARTTLSPAFLGEMAKKLDIDPAEVFDNVIVGAAYNEDRQKLVCNQIVEMLEQDDRDEKTIKLVLMHNATCFLPDSRILSTSLQNLSSVIGKLKEKCSNSRALVVTSSAVGNPSNMVRIPRTLGGSFHAPLDERPRLPPKAETKCSAFSQGNARQAPGNRDSLFGDLGSRPERC